MTRATLVGLAVWVAACTVPPPVRAPTAAPAAVASVDASGARTIALTRRGDLLFAPGEIDGRPVGEFLVDTGASITCIDRDLADALHLDTVIDGTVSGILFDAATSVRTVHTLTVAGVALDANPTIDADLGEALARVGVPVAGIIGYPTLGAAPFTIDYQHATLTLHDPGRFVAPANAKSELLRVNHVPYVEATFENGPLVWLMLDTGAASTLHLRRSFVKQYADVLRVPQKNWVTGVGIGGGTQVMQSEVHALQLFNRAYGTVPVVVQDGLVAGWNHPRVAGIVGSGLLKDFRITIDPTKRRIWAEPQPE